MTLILKDELNMLLNWDVVFSVPGNGHYMIPDETGYY